MTNRCPVCIGSGKIMGSGFMFAKCKQCLGSGKLPEVISQEKPNIDFKIDKRTANYRQSIKRIQELNPGMSHRDAAKLFAEELKKLD